MIDITQPLMRLMKEATATKKTWRDAMRFFNAALLLLCASARADLDFSVTTGEELGFRSEIDRVIEQDGAEWLWGANGGCDSGGCYAAFAFHHSKNDVGLIFMRNGDTWDLLTQAGPSQRRPHAFDVNGDGCLDFITAGISDDSRTHLGDCAGGFVPSAAWSQNGLELSDPEDVNDDGLIDLPFVGSKESAPGVWEISNRAKLNTAAGWLPESVKLSELPETTCPVPQELLDRVSADNTRFYSPKIYTLDENRYIFSYGGSYGGSAAKFHKLVDDCVVVASGLPEVGHILPPVDVNDDGLLDVFVHSAQSSNSGLYVQQADGTFQHETRGDMGGNRGVNSNMAAGPYIWKAWAIDFDNDGDTDLFLNSRRASNGYLLQNDGGVFTLYRKLELVDGYGATPTDMDGDGDIDIIFAGGGVWPRATDSKRNSRMTGILWNNANNAPQPVDPDPVDPDPVDPDPVDPVDPDPVDPVDPDPVDPVDPDPITAVLEALQRAADAVGDAQVCAGQADTGCTQAAIDAARVALMEGEQSLPFP